MAKKFYLTTPIFYANQPPHLGNAYNAVAADVLARYHRQKGEKVFFLTGTDEYGGKIAQAAEKAGKPPQKFVDEIVQSFKETWQALNISHDGFIRTTASRHKKGAGKFLLALKKSGKIYQGKYEGLYCLGCEKFITEKELVGGKCPDHQKEPQKISEMNYFFKLSDFLNKIKKLVKVDKIKIKPLERKNEVLSLLEQGLEDFSISRERVKWGIPLSFDKKQTTYVWIEALANYITAIGYENDSKKFNQLWPADLHLIGKDILKFHAIFWPALLLAVGLRPPQKIFAHGFFTVDGQKMSKSLGNAIDPVYLAEKYSPDAVRYFLLREIPFGQDGDFSLERLEERYNADLANGLGNLVSRVLTLVEKYNNLSTKKSAINADLWRVSNSVWNSGSSTFYQYSGLKDVVKSLAVNNQKALEVGGIEPPDPWLTNPSPRQVTPRAILLYHKAMEEIKFHEALEAIWRLVSAGNEFIEKTKPWLLIKTRPVEFKQVLSELLVTLKEITILLQPFLPTTSEKILRQIKLNRKTETLFPRL